MNSTSQNYLLNLNNQQKEAVIHTDGPLLILAGAGSGKTKVLTTRVAHLIETQKCWASQILCVTFTNKAAKEIKERIAHSLNESESYVSWVGTFHSICSRILRKDGRYVGVGVNFVVYDTNDSLALIKESMKSLNIDIKKINPYAVMEAISSAKNEMVDENEYTKISFNYFLYLYTCEPLSLFKKTS